jgi:hypothetical protein
MRNNEIKNKIDKIIECATTMSIKPEARQACPDPPDPTAESSSSEVKWIGSGRAKVHAGQVRI